MRRRIEDDGCKAPSSVVFCPGHDSIVMTLLFIPRPAKALGMAGTQKTTYRNVISTSAHTAAFAVSNFALS
jgi:hypothetical protein